MSSQIVIFMRRHVKEKSKAHLPSKEASFSSYMNKKTVCTKKIIKIYTRCSRLVPKFPSGLFFIQGTPTKNIAKSWVV